MKERVVLLGSQRSLVGIATDPAPGCEPQPVGVVLLNSGWLHRTGPHRLYVDLARQLAARGYPVVRFDQSGIGDSPVRQDSLPLARSSILEAGEVVAEMGELYGVERCVLMGLCSGGSAAFRAAAENEQVAGAVLINPETYDASPETNLYIAKQGLVRFYWTRAVKDPRRWLRVLTGKSSYQRIGRALLFQVRQLFGGRRMVASVSERVAAEIARMKERGVRLLFLFSEGDSGLDHLDLILGDRTQVVEQGSARKVVVPRSDHTFTLRRSREQMYAIILEWMRGFESRHESTAQRPGRASEPSVRERDPDQVPVR